jgi:hypothetical protein
VNVVSTRDQRSEYHLSLFNHSLICIGYIKSNGWMVVNVESERMCKYAVVASFKIRPQRLPVRTEQKHRNSMRVTGLRGQQPA